MRAGKLDRIITIERKTETVSDSGSVVAAWTEIATTHAEIMRRSFDEMAMGFGEVEAGTTVFRVRWREGITTADRIMFDGIAHDIKEIGEIGRRRALEIRAVAVS
ncbi:phage head closure protein [Mesorhizobium sp. YIM 152430]|uniref:phage head closure protein n=1 Tax=Mesorhizobium sp. YIM 152430 TaxID=3031761 RepID=UPI0023D9D4B1|nr:phage head closure protein [Mesorhizobium sp. YIM 152430]MDF1600163.1 phage head closure protein [Mesorhizobium sp. YIM 152430]